MLSSQLTVEARIRRQIGALAATVIRWLLNAMLGRAWGAVHYSLPQLSTCVWYDFKPLGVLLPCDRITDHQHGIDDG
jgi:hypothetical protein